MSIKNYKAKIDNLLSALQNNPTWPNPSPPLQTIANANNQLGLLEVQSLNGDRTIIAQKRTARATVNALFLELCQDLANTIRNAPNAKELLNGIGLELAHQGSGPRVAALSTPEKLTSQVSREPGAIDLEWISGIRGIRSFVIEICDGADSVNGTWSIHGVSSTMKYTARGLNRAKFYSFRVRSLGAKNVLSDPSAPTTCIAA